MVAGVDTSMLCVGCWLVSALDFQHEVRVLTGYFQSGQVSEVTFTVFSKWPASEVTSAVFSKWLASEVTFAVFFKVASF